ncbi:AMP-binding protein [Flavobacterium amniphilum]|uniref:AMP-binding protein n=1 Tax=Flavobacterium amniphilum TaxID=1834035 RepID=UPI002029D1CE|nr:AMP-binding protein [Flavobacterium amniphilum]MCL9804276.1 AMP-binding protein [Flavobacterium amniphilum]
MTKSIYQAIHPDFKFNGSYLSREELCNIALDYLEDDLEYLKNTGSFLLKWFDDNDFIEVQTSGTTGTPKLITVNKIAMYNSAVATGSFFGLKSGNTALCCLPVKYIAGKMMLIRALVLGLEIDLVEPKSSPMNRDKFYDFVAMVPLQVENSIDKLNLIGQLIIGGTKLKPELASEILKSSCKAFETYSMTETVTHVAAKKVGMEAFKILPNVSISLDNRGCLVIDAPKLNPGIIVTNDLVSIISDAEFIWKGRADNVINSGGIKLFPEQIEDKISDKINNRFFIGGIPDDRLGEKLALIIEGENFTIEEKIFKDLEKYEKPKTVIFVSKFQETETGKIKRKEIMNSIIKKEQL